MAYVAIPYPSVLYAPNGTAQPVATAAAAAALPVTYAASPFVAAPVLVPAVDLLAAYDPMTGLQIVLGTQALAIVTSAAYPLLVVATVGPMAIDTF